MLTKIGEILSTAFPIVWFVVIWLITFYITYLVWFKPSEYQDKMIKAYERLPKWFPFRDSYIDMYRSPTSIWLLRMVTLFVSIVLVAGILFTLWGLLFMR